MGRQRSRIPGEGGPQGPEEHEERTHAQRSGREIIQHRTGKEAYDQQEGRDEPDDPETIQAVLPKTGGGGGGPLDLLVQLPQAGLLLLQLLLQMVKKGAAGRIVRHRTDGRHIGTEGDGGQADDLLAQPGAFRLQFHPCHSDLPLSYLHHNKNCREVKDGNYFDNPEKGNYGTARRGGQALSGHPTL